MSLFVREDYRRRGIASQLLIAVGNCAEWLGYPRLRLRVRRSNAPALGLYEGMGFVRNSVTQAYYSDGEDAIVMSARLPLVIAEEALP